MNYSTIGHHTVEDRDNIDYIENHAPFKCSNRRAWLSYGYYFWEQDLERAIEWGKKNYLNGYVIIECQLDCLNLFDLVGNRNHQKELIELSKILKDYFPELSSKKQPISKIISLLRTIEQRKKGIFSYNSIKAQDHPNRNLYKFVDNRNEVMDLNPRIQICLFEKSDVLLPFRRIVYPEKYVTEN